ncbi:MAG: hypothetical protein RLY43_1393 [Bacteroidota bacterium]|jgi:hypothetical protein
MDINLEKPVLDKFRKEIKFESPLFKFDKVYNDCLANGFLHEYPNRKVSSIYFDDIFNSYLSDSLDGLLKRKKIRLRKYNENILGQLEEKIKNNQLNDKKIKHLEIVPDFTSYDQLLKFVRTYYPNKNLIPASFVSYLRIYLKNKKSNVRITLDYNIETLDFQTNVYKELNDTFIIEVKCKLEAELPIFNLGSQTRFSKYCFSRQKD